MIYINGQIWELAKLQVMRDIERMDTFKIAKFWFYKLKKIQEFGNFDNFKNFKFRKWQIWEIPKISKLENSRIFILAISQNFPNFIIWENSKF